MFRLTCCFERLKRSGRFEVVFIDDPFDTEGAVSVKLTETEWQFVNLASTLRASSHGRHDLSLYSPAARPSVSLTGKRRNAAMLRDTRVFYRRSCFPFHTRAQLLARRSTSRLCLEPGREENSVGRILLAPPAVHHRNVSPSSE